MKISKKIIAVLVAVLMVAVLAPGVSAAAVDSLNTAYTRTLSPMNNLTMADTSIKIPFELSAFRTGDDTADPTATTDFNGVSFGINVSDPTFYDYFTVTGFEQTTDLTNPINVVVAVKNHTRTTDQTFDYYIGLSIGTYSINAASNYGVRFSGTIKGEISTLTVKSNIIPTNPPGSPYSIAQGATALYVGLTDSLFNIPSGVTLTAAALQTYGIEPAARVNGTTAQSNITAAYDTSSGLRVAVGASGTAAAGNYSVEVGLTQGGVFYPLTYSFVITVTSGVGSGNIDGFYSPSYTKSSASLPQYGYFDYPLQNSWFHFATGSSDQTVTLAKLRDSFTLSVPSVGGASFSAEFVEYNNTRYIRIYSLSGPTVGTRYSNLYVQATYNGSSSTATYTTANFITTTTTITGGSGGTGTGEDIYITENRQYVDLSYGDTAISEGNYNNVVFYMGEGVYIQTDVRGSTSRAREYSGTAVRDTDYTDESRLNRYRNFFDVIQLTTYGFDSTNTARTRVRIETDRQYYVINNSLEDIGTTSTSGSYSSGSYPLPYSTRYYLSTSRIGSSSSSSTSSSTSSSSTAASSTPVIEQPGTTNTGSIGATPGNTYPANANYNPINGR